MHEAPDRRTRHAAGRALVALGAPAGPHRYFPPAPVRRATAWLQGHRDEGRPPSTVLLSDPDALVRARAAAALGRLPYRESVPHLAALLTDPEPRVRANAVTALGRLGGDEARAALAGHGDDAHRDVCDALAAALRRIDGSA
ncbi:hypothetical protein CS0771_42120 [Catellatospora sp. IY07-71]|uniref:HEAT repeat domain-containing protein n=1 Tax=Catellatospora sp. IY07-71 TaxID=2728827 RepID=UPI001BB351C3|nr:HEAT repeat domain-containing protein [Catellatospora sp. IY07-71]BCJ74668.1 hypothetical protein CS0771_42120 [Catellatospora sp. IY07-71]